MRLAVVRRALFRRAILCAFCTAVCARRTAVRTRRTAVCARRAALRLLPCLCSRSGLCCRCLACTSQSGGSSVAKARGSSFRRGGRVVGGGSARFSRRCTARTVRRGGGQASCAALCSLHRLDRDLELCVHEDAACGFFRLGTLQGGLQFLACIICFLRLLVERLVIFLQEAKLLGREFLAAARFLRDDGEPRRIRDLGERADGLRLPLTRLLRKVLLAVRERD